MDKPTQRTGRPRLVVVGGVAAGMSAASRAKRVNSNLDVVVLEKGNFISYGACSLPYFVAGHFDDYRTLIARTPEEAARQGIDVRLKHEAVAVDVEGRTVTAVAEGQERHFPFDYLVIATGAEPVVPSAWGLDAVDGAFLLRTIDDARALRRWLGAQAKTGGGVRAGATGKGKEGTSAGGGGSEIGARAGASGDPTPGTGEAVRAVVLGGGYIGVEAADALLERGLQVTVIDMAPQLLTNFDADMALHAEQDLREAGVDVRLGDPVEGIEVRNGRFAGVRLASGAVVEGDLAVVALGVRPNVSLARAAGLRIGETGAIAVDDRQRTNVPYIFAAGDCAEVFHLVTGRAAYIPLGTTANKQGRVAGTVIGGGDDQFPGVVGTAVLKAHRMSLARTGLTEQEAEAFGFDAVAAVISAPDRVHSYPGARELVVKLVAEKGTGRLLGGQVAGPEPLAVSGRIDVVAAAVTKGMTVSDFGHLDLSYAPPFAPVWDPLLVAANVLQRNV